MEKELDPLKMAQLRAIVISICEDNFPSLNMEFIRDASDYTIKQMWNIIMGKGWEESRLKLIDLKRIVDR